MILVMVSHDNVNNALSTVISPFGKIDNDEANSFLGDDVSQQKAEDNASP